MNIFDYAMLKKSLGGNNTGGGGAQPDFNAAEGESGHILNRTHYKEVKNGVLYEGTSADETWTNADSMFIVIDDNIPIFTIGETYSISWNGTVYNCEAISADGMGTAFGNVGALQEGYELTDHPFVIVVPLPELVANMGGNAMIVPMDGSTEIALTISGESVYIKKIDKEFIPEELLSKIAFITIDENGVASHKAGEIYALSTFGKVVYLQYYGDLFMYDCYADGVAFFMRFSNEGKHILYGKITVDEECAVVDHGYDSMKNWYDYELRALVQEEIAKLTNGTT